MKSSKRQQKPQQQPAAGRKRAPVLIAAGAVLGAAATMLVSQLFFVPQAREAGRLQAVATQEAAEHRPTFANAKRCSAPTPACHSLRMQHIATTIEEIGLPAYVRGVTYGTKPPGMRETSGYRRLMAVIELPDPLTIGSRTTIVNIEVYPDAYEKLETGEDFRSSLEHEYRHAEQFHYGTTFGIERFIEAGSSPTRPIYSGSLYGAYIELDAIRAEFNRQGLSTWYKKALQETYLDEYAKLWVRYTVDPSLIHSLKVEFFEPWMKGRSEFAAENETWYLNHRGQKLELPSEVKSK